MVLFGISQLYDAIYKGSIKGSAKAQQVLGGSRIHCLDGGASSN